MSSLSSEKTAQQVIPDPVDSVSLYVAWMSTGTLSLVNASVAVFAWRSATCACWRSWDAWEMPLMMMRWPCLVAVMGGFLCCGVMCTCTVPWPFG